MLVAHGLAELPIVSLALGLAGAMAVVAVSALMAQSDLFRPLRYCGRNSIVIYLAFFLPMALSRTALLKAGWHADPGTIAALVTLAGVLGSLLLFWSMRATPLRFLFERPDRFCSRPNSRAPHSVLPRRRRRPTLRPCLARRNPQPRHPPPPNPPRRSRQHRNRRWRRRRP
jgi:uncharacterized membrane protein YcfT